MNITVNRFEVCSECAYAPIALTRPVRSCKLPWAFYDRIPTLQVSLIQRERERELELFILQGLQFRFSHKPV